MDYSYAVHAYSHWQRAPNPGRRLAVLGTREAAQQVAHDLSTCSFCSPGRAAGYSVGACYEVYRGRLPVTDDSADEALIRLRDRDPDDD